MKQFIFVKEVDWSLFHDGMHIPADVSDLCMKTMGISLQRGEGREVNVHFTGADYVVSLRNLPLNTAPGHAEMLHIRWHAASPIASALKNAYEDAYHLLEQERITLGKGKHARLPLADRQFLRIYILADGGFYFDT